MIQSPARLLTVRTMRETILYELWQIKYITFCPVFCSL
nr:MAG TPA: hypothetical protein [Caudoviricetes sp.]